MRLRRYSGAGLDLPRKHQTLFFGNWREAVKFYRANGSSRECNGICFRVSIRVSTLWSPFGQVFNLLFLNRKILFPLRCGKFLHLPAILWVGGVLWFSCLHVNRWTTDGRMEAHQGLVIGRRGPEDRPDASFMSFEEKGANDRFFISG